MKNPKFIFLQFVLPLIFAILPAHAQERAKDFSIRIDVEEVRLDAVVLDKKGRQITDLTAADFEIYQDDQLQEVRGATYISDQTQPMGRSSLSSSRSQVSPSISTPPLKRDQVRRVIAFVVDDLTMHFEAVHYARMAMRKFVETQMQPGDLVAILRTSRGMSAFQMFLSDREQLLAKIENVRWGAMVGQGPTDDNPYLFYGQGSAIRYCIRALKDMPGRKALLLLTTTVTGAYPDSYNRLADEAWRAGVVIHVMDVKGLEASFPVPWSGLVGFQNEPSYGRLSMMRMSSQNSLPRKTGGLLVTESNFFLDGIGEVNHALKGYYLLSYVPPPTTFKLNRRDIYHRVRIKVKRRGATVHARDGFYGRAETAEEPARANNPMWDAIFSPFQYSELKVNLLSGFIDDFRSGYIVSSCLHLDAQDVSAVEKNEGRVVSLETVSVTSDINGLIQDSSIMKYDFLIKEENLPWIKEHGIRFSLQLPVKRPGPYYMRVAVRDPVSGKVGSAYQFVDIPDLKKDRLALSDLFVINKKDDTSWIRSGVSKETAQRVPVPILHRDESRSPALRDYAPGEHFEYMSVVYNSKHRKTAAPELESWFVLYKDGGELFKSEPKPLSLSEAVDYDRIPFMQRLVLGSSLQTGDYVLQLLVKDKGRGGKKGLASQTLTFAVSADESVTEAGH